MSSMFQSFQKKEALPVSQTGASSGKDEQAAAGGAIRRRLSSLSLRIQQSATPISGYSGGAAASWAFRRSKSVSSMGEYAGSSIRKWWDWGWGWILSRKPTFARDLEMNDEEKVVLGSQSKGSWRHVFYKVRSEIRKLIASDNAVGLPQTVRYDTLSYSKNFDGGNRAANLAH